MASHTYIDPVTASTSEQSATIFIQKITRLTAIDQVGGILCHICHLTISSKKEYDSHYLQHNTGSKDIVYTCVLCNRQISGYRSFRGHCYNNHVVKERFRCEHCNKFFSRYSALKLHIDNLHKYKCVSCKKEFSSKKELELHQIIHKDDKLPFKCQICSETIANNDTCEDHVERHAVFTYSCPICNETITNKQNAREHLSIHFDKVVNNNEGFTEDSKLPADSCIDMLGGMICSYCANFYKNRGEFDSHFTDFHPDETIIYSCNICDKQYEKYITFRNHCYNHITKDRFKCDLCDKTFTRLSKLVRHMEAHHSNSHSNDDSKLFNCTECELKFTTDDGLQNHIQNAVHDVLKCTQQGCQMTFGTPKDLTFHQRDHKNTANKRCISCGLHFVTLTACERHLDVHKKKLFSCPVCGKNYGEKYLMMKHIPQHFEAVFYVCKVCGKIYNAKNRLVQHSKIHSTLKTHNCSYCGKGFINSYCLKQHINVHTGLKPYSCVVCPKKFAGHSNWFKHLQRMHSIDPKTIKKPTNQNAEFESTTNVLETPYIKNYGEVEMNVELAISNNVKRSNVDEQTNCNKSTVYSNLNNPTDINSLHSNIKENFAFQKSETIEGENLMELENVEPLTINNDLQIHEHIKCDDAELADGYSVTTFFVSDPLPSDEIGNEAQTAGRSSSQSTVVPREYGPDFINTGFEFASYNGQLIDLGDHILPHIDPLLTTKQTTQYADGINNVEFDNFDRNIVDTSDFNTKVKIEPSTVAKLYQNYSYGYSELTDNTGRLSVMNTDLF